VTRERLRSALREMWQSELHLRMGDPIAALPYQYRALDLIKQIQQASRIYLARVGLELPPIMFSRRLTGDRSTAVRPGDPLRAAERGDAALVGMFSALAGRGFGIGDSGFAGGEADGEAALSAEALNALEAWLAGQPIESTLDLRERFDRVRRDPDCADCRAALASSLWQRLTPPPLGPRSRAGLDAAGEGWLRALEQAR
jgi:hypothetical protein